MHFVTCDLDLRPFDLIYIGGWSIVMDYLCANFGDFSYSHSGWTCGQTNRITDAVLTRLPSALVIFFHLIVWILIVFVYILCFLLFVIAYCHTGATDTGAIIKGYSTWLEKRYIFSRSHFIKAVWRNIGVERRLICDLWAFRPLFSCILLPFFSFFFVYFF